MERLGVRSTKNLREECFDVVGEEGMLQRSHLVEDTAQTPNVALIPVRLVLTYF